MDNLRPVNGHPSRSTDAESHRFVGCGIGLVSVVDVIHWWKDCLLSLRYELERGKLCFILPGCTETKRSSAIGLKVFGNVGEVKVSATVASYLDNHLAIVALDTEPEVRPPITDDVVLQLVGAPRMVPDAITLFNHPTNKGNGLFVNNFDGKD